MSAALLLALLAGVQARADNAQVLKIITWADYVPAEVIAQFGKETGIQVQVTLSNNEEMISKLRATGGAGFDLAQPSQDRILGAQQEFRIYKPFDTGKVRLDEFVPELLDIIRKNATIDGKLYGLPYIWGTEGLIYNSKRTRISDYPDLCKPELRGRTAVRLKRPTLMAFALASGRNPFALYDNTKAYTALMEQVGKTLAACKVNFRFFYDNKDQLLNGVRSGEIDAAMMWDSGGWALNSTKTWKHFVSVATMQKRPLSSTAPTRLTRSRPRCGSLATTRAASATPVSSSNAWPLAIAGTSSSTSARDSPARLARPRCPPSSMSTAFPAPSPIRCAWPSVCTRG